MVVVDSCKPRFFSTGTPLQRVDTSTSNLVPLSASISGPHVYSGGNHTTITSMLGAKGPDVIYAGDHLLADVIKCRKLCEWRTLLIVPELLHELEVTQKNFGLLKQLSCACALKLCLLTILTLENSKCVSGMLLMS